MFNNPNNENKNKQLKSEYLILKIKKITKVNINAEVIEFKNLNLRQKIKYKTIKIVELKNNMKNSFIKLLSIVFISLHFFKIYKKTN